MIMHVLELTEPVRCSRGFYLKFADASGAEIWLQGNFEQELIGFNPHFAGTSIRQVGLINAVERDSSELDGGFHAWANPQEDSGGSGDYPFVFDVPDFRTIEQINFPHVCEIQLTAFASNDFVIFPSETEYEASQTSELKYASKSFVPIGLFASGADDEAIDFSAVRPIARFTGEIKEFALKTNELSGENFYWFLVNTLGGEIDVVADAKLIQSEPQICGVVSGQFWLSGRIETLSK